MSTTQQKLKTRQANKKKDIEKLSKKPERIPVKQKACTKNTGYKASPLVVYMKMRYS